MHFVVEPSDLSSGTVTVPGDKSISHRALILGGIAYGNTNISGFLDGEDCLATLAALQSMGVNIERHAATDITIEGCGDSGLRAPLVPLDMGNSGTAMRLFAGLLSGHAFSSQLIGDASLSSRPMNRIIDPLRMMGADIESADGKPPLRVLGGQQLSGITYRLPVASAQVKSAILLAGLKAKGETAIIEPAVTRDHTERMLRTMGVDVMSGKAQITMQGGQRLTGTEVKVPADLSSAAFVVLATILAADSEIRLSGVGVNPTRTGVIDILREMGADIVLDNARMYGEEPVADLLVRSSQLHGIEVLPEMVSLAIDEFPILFIAAAVAKGTTSFTGLGELRLKESDRIATMASGLRALGVNITESADGAVIEGGEISGGTVDSHGDHRVAMSFAVAATRAGWPVRIDDTAAVNTSFPGFVACFQELGVRISCVDETP